MSDDIVEPLKIKERRHNETYYISIEFREYSGSEMKSKAASEQCAGCFKHLPKASGVSWCLSK